MNAAPLVCCCALLLAAGCSGRYVGPGSGTRDARLQQRELQKSESTAPVDPRVTGAQQQAEIDKSGIPVTP